jgi:hypothetical protein
MYDCSLMSVLRDVDLLHLGTLSLWPCSDPPNFLSSPYHLRSLPLPACFYSFLSPCSTHTDPLHQIQHTQLWCLQTLTFLSFLPSPSNHSFLQVQNHWFSTILPTTNLTLPGHPYTLRTLPPLSPRSFEFDIQTAFTRLHHRPQDFVKRGTVYAGYTVFLCLLLSG